MKFVSFATRGGRKSFGAVSGLGVVDLARHFPEVDTLRTFIASSHWAERDAIASLAADLDLTDIIFDPVIPNPDKIICVGLNYHDHVEESGRTVTQHPALFARYAASQVGHEQPLVRPPESEKFDYEGELAIVVGKAGRRIPRERAFEHIAGYSCYNDGSIRDWQLHTSQYLAGKTFESTGGFGPWLVTNDEIADPDSMILTTRLNGQEVQKAAVGMMITSIADIVAYCSTAITLLPGDVIVTGTPGGVGAKRTPPLWMRPGDVAEVEITGIGTLRNSVAAET